MGRWSVLALSRPQPRRLPHSARTFFAPQLRAAHSSRMAMSAAVGALRGFPTFRAFFSPPLDGLVPPTPRALVVTRFLICGISQSNVSYRWKSNGKRWEEKTKTLN